MPAEEDVVIASEALSATVSPVGAELRTLRDADGRDLLWDGDPAVWAGRAPILFPVVGATQGDEVRIDGRAYPMAKHGFARRSTFAVVERGAAYATFCLSASEETRRHYPFDYRLDLRFAIEGARLSMTATVANEDRREIPASFGFHPAFRWPLPYGRPRADHRMLFAEPEPAPIRRIGGDGLLRPGPEPSPIEGRTLTLRDSLFEDDAIILDRPASRALRYGAANGPALEIAWDLPQLGLWTKPGAHYVCVEPWQGHADPRGYAGEMADKPGVVRIPPGGAARFAMHVALADGA